MTEQAAEDASARIERALARIEAAAARSIQDRTVLERRHAALRGEVGAALTMLNALIAEDAA